MGSSGTFTIRTDDKKDIVRGTEITLHLRDDAKNYCKEKSIKDLVRKHSEFIAFPISLFVTKEEEKEVEVSDDEEEDEDKEKDKSLKWTRMENRSLRRSTRRKKKRK